MKFDLGWLTEILEDSPEADELADRLTACGFLVEIREPADGSEVWDVEVTTNRPDAMNHRGLAREAAVATGAGLRPLVVELEEIDEPAADSASVEIEAPELCSRYVARVVRGISIGESPDWMARRLEACGVRPINAVVDATNYVLLELGQPLHAFDLDKVAGRRIVTRRAAPGERLKTLDGLTRILDESMLVVADDREAVALAGIMGGADSEIGSETVDILIESAHFDALSVRRTARKLGMHTEASHRFERGADPEMAAVACDAAASLIAQLCGGRVCRGRIDVYPRPWSPKQLEFSLASLAAFTGMPIDEGQVVRIFGGLEFSPEADGDRIAVAVPPFRVDVEVVPDLYEEVIRQVGYDAVPSSLPILPTPPGHRNPNWVLVDRGREAAVSAGLIEVMTLSFVGSDDDALVDRWPLCPGGALPLDNPLATTQDTMRRSLLPGMLAAARETLNRGERSLTIFEQGRVFAAGDDEALEFERLAVVLSGTTVDGRTMDFSDLKGIVGETMDRAGFPTAAWDRGGAPWLDQAEGAVITVDGTTAGCAGLLDNAIGKRWDLRQPVYVAELDLGVAFETPTLVQFQPLPKFPAVAADMTVEHAADLPYSTIYNTVVEMAGERVESVDLVVRYTGEGLTDGAVRTTLRLVYRNQERSLTQEEVNADQDDLRNRLRERLGVDFA